MVKVEKLEDLKNRIWNCKICNYNAKRSDLYNKHLSTDKHKNKCLSIGNGVKVEEVIKVENVVMVDDKQDKRYECVLCNKKYKCNSGLWRHKKICPLICPEIEETKIVEKTDVSSSGDYKDIILELVKENKEMRTMMIEQQKTIGELIPIVGNNNNSTTNNNTINQKFNINVFLNEQCKGAINMSDFIKSIEVSLEQLDFTKTNGLEKGISNVIMENMNKLSLYERPIHCTDAKRETLYIKDNNIWEKDTDKSKIKRAIQKTSNKNYTALTNWTKANPNFMKDDDKQMFYAKAISKIGKPMDGIDDKIVKNLCNNTKLKEIKGAADE
jgi:hypothetical protein